MNVLAARLAARPCEPVEPYQFYREIFGDDTLDVAREKGEWTERDPNDPRRYYGIMVLVEKAPQDPNHPRIIRRVITDDLNAVDEMQWEYSKDYFCVTSPISYAGYRRTGENARYLYALAIDLDDLTVRNGNQVGLNLLMSRFDKGTLPRPTYLVASGNGLHLYYALDEPIPMRQNMAVGAQAFKTELTLKLWSRGITNLYRKSDIQIGSIFQGFRMPGSMTKSGDLVEAFRVGDKVSREYLNSFVGPDAQIPETPMYRRGKYTREEAVALFPGWTPVAANESTRHWQCHPGLYYWWLGRIREETKPGHRYFCLMYLAVFAKKCGVPIDDLERDAMELLPSFAAMGASPRNQKPFTECDARSALRAYNDTKLQNTNVDIISLKTGIPIERNNRNGRTRAEHLKLARERLTELSKRGEARPGRPCAREAIAAWRTTNPLGRKADCVRETGLSKPTVYKWWAAVAETQASADVVRAVAGPGAPRCSRGAHNSYRRRPRRRPKRLAISGRLRATEAADEAANSSSVQTLSVKIVTSG